MDVLNPIVVPHASRLAVFSQRGLTYWAAVGPDHAGCPEGSPEGSPD